MCNITREAASQGFTTDAVVLSSSAAPQALVGIDPERRSVTVLNDPDGANSVYIVPTSSTGLASGVKLKPGASITLATIAGVYAIAASGGTVYVITETGAKL